MAAKIYKAYNGAEPTTAKLTPVTTGTAIKTLLQIAPLSTVPIRVVEWGISFDGTAVNTPIVVELIDTDVAATVTAHVAAGIIKLNAPNDAASTVQLGTALSGYTASAEGTPGSTSRLLHAEHVSPTSGFRMQYPLGREPEIAVSRFLRIRVTAAAAVNALCDITWEE